MSSETTQRTGVDRGLQDYYASQAKVMLAQYENINRLLGATDDWTHPGDYCEILLRDFLRRLLPPSVSVGKGFFYGRAELEGQDQHCPEIDVLIYDNTTQKPLFQMGDFVIVPPESVRGIIQVKRTMKSDKLKSALSNVVKAKAVLRKVLQRSCVDGRLRPCLTAEGHMPPIMSGVISFRSEGGINADSYRRQLAEHFVWTNTEFGVAGPRQSHMWYMPNCIGSFGSDFLAINHRDRQVGSYSMAVASEGNGDLFLQILLGHICSDISKYEETLGTNLALPVRLAIPSMKCTLFDVVCYEKWESIGNGCVALTRSDGCRFALDNKRSRIDGQAISYIFKKDGTVETIETGHMTLNPREIVAHCESADELVCWDTHEELPDDL